MPPLPCTGCVGFLQCQLSGLWGWGGGAACRASVSLPPYCHLPLCSWQSCEGEGKASGMFGLLFLWALYNFKGFPLVHRGQGAEVSRHGLTSLSPPPQKGEMHTHTHRGRRKGRRDPGKHFYPLIFLHLSAVEALSGRQSALWSLTLPCWTFPLPCWALPPPLQGGNKAKQQHHKIECGGERSCSWRLGFLTLLF